MHLLESNGERILLDCGLFQGRRDEARTKNEAFPLEPDDVTAVVLSHAHIDHAGRLPLFHRRGYRGPIFCTPATADLAAIMLPDSGHIQESDAEWLRRRGKTSAEPLYTRQDAVRVAEQMVGVPYERALEIRPGVTLSFHEAGHILGSASVVLDLDGGTPRRIVFSGDIGRAGLPIIRDPKSPAGPRADALIIESTYAGRVHETVEQAADILAGHVQRVAKRGGKIFIPAFAVGRTQEVLYELHALVRDGRIPEIPIYIDSPLAVSATDIFRRHPEVFDRSEQLVEAVDDPLRFPMVTYVRSVEESKALNGRRGPMIIIAASGMAESGRIVHHLRNGLGDARNMVMLVGWQGSHTLGERLRSGAREVRIFGDEVAVNAEVQMVAGYSAHGDRNDLSAWVSGMGPPPRRAFCVHGEAGLTAMAGILRDLEVPDVAIPALGQSFKL